MARDNIHDKSAPNSKRLKNLPQKAAGHFFGQSSAWQPKVFIRTFGCQMNVRDSEVICGLLTTENYQLTTKSEEADIIIFNTCSVRQHAEDKVWSEIGKFKKGQGLSPKGTVPGDSLKVPFIGLIGCMAQEHKEKIFQRAPNVDFVVGPSDIHKIPEIVKQLTVHSSQFTANHLFETKIWETDGGIRPEEIYHTGFSEDKNHAYVVISEGCSNSCSYCVVPYVRGQLQNRNDQDILREIEEAVDRGITKVTLLGQNVNAYVSNSKFKIQNPKSQSQTQDLNKEVNFIDLLKMVNKIKGLEEFSFITSHPKDTSEDLFKAMAELDKLKKHLHLPVQSGADRILKLMKRGYTREDYLDLIEDYRKIVKDGILTTDIIVGFPTERDEDFDDTHNLVHAVGFDAAYIFKYSPRPHTEAGNLIDDVPKEEKKRRHRIILELQKEISKSKKC